jgi:hypothetical protein
MISNESLYEVWSNRTPLWEKRFKEPLFERFTNYGTGADSTVQIHGKVFGGAYELFIIAFFIGLNCNKTRALPIDKDELTKFRHEIKFWGNVGGTKGRAGNRKDYGLIREFMFAALLARTDIDFIALEKGEIPVSEAASKLLRKMEEYGNYGLQYLYEETLDRPELFRREAGFFDIFDEIHRKYHPETIPSEAESELTPDDL